MVEFNGWGKVIIHFKKSCFFAQRKYNHKINVFVKMEYIFE